ncbi:MAG: hypothetical protein GXO83_06160 [Chlorobi bacterium]|nr:hypothetical protein [Chlorobiota bacterium]
MKKAKYDVQLTGWITGLVLPLLSFFIISKLMLTEGTLIEFIAKADKANVLSKFMSLAMLPNLLLFFIFLWTRWDRASRGVLAATIVLAVVIVIVKFAV